MWAEYDGEWNRRSKGIRVGEGPLSVWLKPDGRRMLSVASGLCAGRNAHLFIPLSRRAEAQRTAVQQWI